MREFRGFILEELCVISIPDGGGLFASQHSCAIFPLWEYIGLLVFCYQPWLRNSLLAMEQLHLQSLCLPYA